MPPEVLAWGALLVSVAFPAGVFIARNFIKSAIERGVQYNFDLKIEDVKAELRKNEERIKSELRDREAEITSLRQSVLSGSANRQSLLDKRRFESVEKVWIAVNDLARLKTLSSMMAVLKFKEMAKRASDPKLQQFLAVMGAGAPEMQDVKNVARDEQPFIPDIAWAYFSAYITILYGSLLRYNFLKIGLDDADKYLTNEPTKKLLKAALPHQAAFIDKYEPESYHYLLEEIEALLLAELRKVLEGRAADHDATRRAKEIMDAVKESDKARVEAANTAAVQS